MADVELVIKMPEEVYKSIINGKNYISYQEYVEEAIKNGTPLPEGHWRPIYQGDEIIDYRCSECEFGNTFGKSTHGMNYCPNCGAKMIKPQGSEGVE